MCSIISGLSGFLCEAGYPSCVHEALVEHDGELGFASAHSRGGRFHSAAAWFKTRYSSLVAASSDGKCPLVRTARRSFEFSASIALVV